jgi:hypothetical protein
MHYVKASHLEKENFLRQVILVRRGLSYFCRDDESFTSAHDVQQCHCDDNVAAPKSASVIFTAFDLTL